MTLLHSDRQGDHVNTIVEPTKRSVLPLGFETAGGWAAITSLGPTAGSRGAERRYGGDLRQPKGRV